MSHHMPSSEGQSVAFMPEDLPEKPFNFTLILAVLLIAGLGLMGWKVFGPGHDTWLHDLSAGVAAAEESGRPILVFYTADWCPPCRKLKSDVLSDPDVEAYLQENFVRVKIDLSDRSGPNARTAAEFGVTGIPTVIFYDYQGVETNRITGGEALAGWFHRNAY